MPISMCSAWWAARLYRSVAINSVETLREFRVIKGHRISTNQNGIYDFLLVTPASFKAISNGDPREYVNQHCLVWNQIRWATFCRRLCMRISMALGVASCQSWQKSRKMPKKTRFVGSRSFQIILFDANRKGICDFLFVTNSNLGSVSHGFRAMATFGQKVASVNYLSFNALVIPCEYVDRPHFVKKLELTYYP